MLRKEQIYQLNGKHYKVREIGKDADGPYVKASLYNPETDKCQKGRPNKFASGEFTKATLFKDVTTDSAPKPTPTAPPAQAPVAEGEETLEDIIENSEPAEVVAVAATTAKTEETDAEKKAWREKILTNLGFSADQELTTDDW